MTHNIPIVKVNCLYLINQLTIYTFRLFISHCSSSSYKCQPCIVISNICLCIAHSLSSLAIIQLTSTSVHPRLRLGSFFTFSHDFLVIIHESTINSLPSSKRHLEQFGISREHNCKIKPGFPRGFPRGLPRV